MPFFVDDILSHWYASVCGWWKWSMGMG